MSLSSPVQFLLQPVRGYALSIDSSRHSGDGMLSAFPIRRTPLVPPPINNAYKPLSYKLGLYIFKIE